MIKDKIKTINGLIRIVLRLKRNKKKIVFTNGCFDLLHRGHVQYLEKAKTYGDILIVAINTDASVNQIKGRLRPIVSEKERVALVAALESVDYVTTFTQPTPLDVIKKIKPDVLIKGSDWKEKDIVGVNIVKRCGGKIKRIKHINDYSTTKLIKKIVAKNIHR